MATTPLSDSDYDRATTALPEAYDSPHFQFAEAFSNLLLCHPVARTPAERTFLSLLLSKNIWQGIQKHRPTREIVPDDMRLCCTYRGDPHPESVMEIVAQCEDMVYSIVRVKAKDGNDDVVRRFCENMRGLGERQVRRLIGEGGQGVEEREV
ncbi:hypothetical protein CC86DRAFT_386126 [Ophiobolus disseminans]|uniref:Uncharacterized protein n=1 Tax=Ophiobolus disseminans TaxID=1469910 RepID=A0A6A6ZLK0_9PLEO|nr:hypothetical protein CC86DRAFT_386126 [Ophiobolus disseminans]